ncbi:MAG: isocitrate lyase/phosphoenolpyruvate mutase family protein [Candidatus Binatia bacterium]|jgi:methylisocitrate lyase
MNDKEKRMRLGEILADPKGAIAPGIVEPIFARLAADCGYRVAHLSGNAIHKSFCLPDRNLLTVTEIAQKASQIADATDIPLIVDGGFVARENDAIARGVRSLERAGAAAIRFEDSSYDPDRAAAGDVTVVPKSLMVDNIKAAVDARHDPTLVLIARCDARPLDSLAQVEERLAAYIAAGADAVGVQLSDAEEFRQIGARAQAPLVSLWPRARMTVFEFLQSGYRIALMPSSVPLAALAAVKQMLLELKETGTERDYFNRQKDIQGVESWYRDLDIRRP